MPIRYISVPQDVLFKDPVSGEPIKDANGQQEKLTFEAFLQKLMHNPMWSENYHNTKAQDEIMDAWEKCKAEGGEMMLLGEEEWQRLKQAVEFPKTEVITPMGAQIRVGLGYLAALSRQILPMSAAVVEAPTTDPRTKKPDKEKPVT